MNYRVLFALVAVVAPFEASSYAPVNIPQNPAPYGGGSSSGDGGILQPIPSHEYPNKVIYDTKPLPPIVVNQPHVPPVHVSSGPAAIVKTAPVVYKMKPSVIYQNEVINKIPDPVNIKKVYVKVSKPQKPVYGPTVPIYPKNNYQSSYMSSGGYNNPVPNNAPRAPAYGSSGSSYGASVRVDSSPVHTYGSPVSEYKASDPVYSSPVHTYGSSVSAYNPGSSASVYAAPAPIYG